MGTFLFRWPYPADHVYVTGDFDDWGKTEKLEKVGDVFEKEVHLPVAKHYYKFVVDDNWIVDDQAPKEDDGHYNVNNVLLPENITKSPATKTRSLSTGHRVVATSSSPPGSNSGEGALTEAPTVSAGGDGAPLLTKEQSEANLARWVPHVIPDADRPVTRSLPQSDGAATSKTRDADAGLPGAFPETPANEPESFGVNPIPATGHDHTRSSVTTSKEDYENAGGEGTASNIVSTQPILPPGEKGLGDSATTSKEAYDKVGGTADDEQQLSVNPLPARGHDNIQSSVTTSKEDYEKAGAFGLAGAAVAGVGATVASAFSKPKHDDKNIIPESSLPMNPDKTDTLDAGPFMSSAGPGTTTADLAAKVPLEPKRQAEVVDPTSTEAPEASKQAAAIPFISSSGAGTTTSQLAAQVPLEAKRDAEVVDAPGPQKTAQDTDPAPFLASAGPNATTAGLASQVPLEEKRQGVVVDDETLADKSAVETELLKKVPESQATGEPASAAAGQTSYYGLATTVPAPVEASLQKAHASPEAAADASVVAEKSAVERELQATVPKDESAGEPAPAFAAATSSTAPGTGSTAATAAAVTDGTTANEAVPGTDTSTQHRGLSTGEIAGGAVVGGAAAAGAAALAAKHDDKEVEPPRVADSVKPSITTEAAPASQLKSDHATSPTSGFGATSPKPGVSPSAGAALSDGTEDPTVADEPSAPTTKAPVETSEATATEYAPPQARGIAPGVSPAAGAALADGTEDPTQVEGAPVNAAVTQPHKTTADEASAPTTKPDGSSAVDKTPETPKKTLGPAAAGGTPASSSSTPAKSTTESPATGDKKKKKRNRLSQIIHKIFD